MSKDNPTKQEIKAIMLLVKNGWLKLEVIAPALPTEDQDE